MTPSIAIKKKRYLVVVADEYQVILYEREGLKGPLRQLRTLTNKEARMKTEELLADRGGRSFDSHGQGRHTMGMEKDSPKQHGARVFAKDIAEWVGAEMHKGAFDGFALIAAPKFLGMLRQELASATKAEPYATIDTEVAGQKEPVIAKLLESATAQAETSAG
jgi:protein required for attachment to host cells